MINGRIVLVLFAVLIACGAAVSVQAQASAGGAIVAIDEPEDRGGSGGGRPYSGGGTVRQSGGKTVKQTGTKVKPRATATRTVAPPVQRALSRWNGPVLGDKYTFLNFEVVSAAKPYHTREAKANGAKGLVQVEVLIDTDGSVISARARTGNPLLHPEAERAARESRFNRPTADGRPARATGFLVYRFGPAEDDD
jgi:hypothetical protein